MGVTKNIKDFFSGELKKSRGYGSEIAWISVPGGEFIMGSPENESNRKEDETTHPVTILPFRISKNAITVYQYKHFVESTGYITDSEKGLDGDSGCYVWNGYSSKFKQGVNWKYDERGRPLDSKKLNHPVIHISWNDAYAYAEWKGCRLPTEAEWEYACRANTKSPFNTGNNLNINSANYKPNNAYVRRSDIAFNNEILTVGKLRPNAWGLYDVHGNVWEWCNDYYAPYPNVPQIDPKGPETGKFRVARGGSWLSQSENCRSARRAYYQQNETMYDIGFRVAMSEK